MQFIALKGDSHGRSPRSIISIFAVTVLLAPPSHATSTEVISNADADLIVKVLLALGTVFIAQAIIPLIKTWYQNRKQRSTYRNYLLAHVTNTLEHFKGAGSSHFASKHLVNNPDADWFKFLTEHNLGVPEIFTSVMTVIEKTLSEDKYIPSVSYFGLDGNLLDHTSPIWDLDGPESKAALEYFITQQQIETSLDYQYNGWYFDLIKSNKSDRERWCRGLENVLYDMAQHYKAARRLQVELKKLV